MNGADNAMQRPAVSGRLPNRKAFFRQRGVAPQARRIGRNLHTSLCSVVNGPALWPGHWPLTEEG